MTPSDKTVDPISALPDGVLSQIFRFVELEDVLTRCPFVSKAWNAFFRGCDEFWEELILTEFGNNREYHLKKPRHASVNLRKLLMSPGFASDLISFVDFGLLSGLNKFSSVETFIVALASRPSPFPTGQRCVMAESNSNKSKNKFFFAAYLPSFFNEDDDLPFHFRITLLHYSPVEKIQYIDVACFGKYFDLLDRQRGFGISKPHEMAIVVQCKPGTHYIVARMSTPNIAVRFLMPSHGRRFETLKSVLENLQPYLSPSVWSMQCDVLRKDRALVNWSINGITPLMLACGLRSLKVVRTLLELGAAVNNTRGPATQATALSYAVLAGDIYAVEELLFYGANPNLGNNEWKPLFDAIFGSASLAIAKLLVKYGANVNARLFASRDTMLIHAVKFQHKEAVRNLLQLAADPCIENADGKTVFDYCTDEQSPLWGMFLK